MSEKSVFLGIVVVGVVRWVVRVAVIDVVGAGVAEVVGTGAGVESPLLVVPAAAGVVAAGIIVVTRVVNVRVTV